MLKVQDLLRKISTKNLTKKNYRIINDYVGRVEWI
jgi:hypothetical protein